MSYKQMYISLIPYSDGCSQIMSKLGKQFNIVVVHNNKHVVHGLSLTCTIDGYILKILFFLSKSCPVVIWFVFSPVILIFHYLYLLLFNTIVILSVCYSN